ncbi:MAG: tetratricopeptide repeat protein, partial [Candidatus Thalassarchaeaceae archaeon]|nr:tetratricopeptide repeat protein [Candidatus Thalassarchaeaceae archaeon]
EDPWAAFSRTESEDEEIVEPQISTEEIIAHEAALDTVQEPEPITYEPVSEVVDLAAAALEAQAGIMTEYQVQADSSSVANQDIEWYNKGIELLNKDRYKEALSCFDRSLPSFKDDKAMAIKILNGRGNCFYYLNQFKEAIENYYKAFGIDKGLTTGNALYNMGTAYAELESYDNAIHCFNQSMGKDVGEPLKGENKKRAKEQIRRCKLLVKEQNKRAA